jgi:hypothetical protein
MKLLSVILLALLLFDCGKKKPVPPRPTPTPVVTPTPDDSPTPSATPSPAASPSLSPTPTPAPTPEVDLSKYIPARPQGPAVTVSGEGLSAAIQKAQDDPQIASVHVTGGGSLTEPIILRKYTTFDSATYSCDMTLADLPAFHARLRPEELAVLKDIPFSNYGAFLVMDGVYVGGTWKFPQAILDLMRATGDPVERAKKMAAIPAGGGTTILEPSFSLTPAHPLVEVFQAWGDVCCSHTGKANSITIQGFKIKGRQTVYDGGVRSTVLLGNCEHCAVTDVYLEDTASIGITAGGSALEKDNFANDVVFTRNMFSGVAAANTATINTENAYVFENYVRRPGHHEPKFGGGVCGHDHETNSPADHTRNIYIFNNFYDYEDAHDDGAGTGICLQDPYAGAARGKVVAVNNLIIGGRLDGTRRYMSNGLILVGIHEFQIINNHIFRTGQNAIQVYNVDNGLIQDNVFDSTGGGGNPSFWSQGMRNTIVRRNNYLRRDIPINMEAGFMEVCGSGNTFEGNFIPGVGSDSPSTKRCP